MRLFWFTLGGALVLASTTISGKAFGQTDVSQRGYDRFRTGVNSSETVLKPANVASTANQFHKRFLMKVDGKIEGSPLYAAGVTVAGGLHNVIYVATMHNTVFAFDADTGAQLSTRQVDAPVTGYDIGTIKPATIHHEWGIVSTPAIDRSTGTIYLVRWGYENGTSGPGFPRNVPLHSLPRNQRERHFLLLRNFPEVLVNPSWKTDRRPDQFRHRALLHDITALHRGGESGN